jgi:hypothetical protein
VSGVFPNTCSKALVADAYNPSYSRGRVQGDGLKPALDKYFERPYFKKKSQKKTHRVSEVHPWEA